MQVALQPPTPTQLIPTETRVWTDGGNRGNPGPAASAFVVDRCDGNSPVEDVVSIGIGTNNDAEYNALINALRYLYNAGIRNAITIHSDSELIVRQVNGEYVCRSATLMPLYDEAVGMFELLKSESVSLRLIHVRRQFNKHADRICTEFLDAATGNKRQVK